MNYIRFVSFLALGGVAATLASATDSMSVSGFAPGKFNFISVSFNGGAYNSTKAGPLLASLNSGAAFEAYCVDLANAVNTTSTYQVNSLNIGSNLSNGGRVAYLYTTYAPTINSTNYATPTALAEAGAGLQAAIWDVVYDNGDGFTTGNVKIQPTGNVLTYATSFESGSSGHTATGTLFDSVPVGASKAQNLAVPEPMSLSILSVGAVALLRRRKR